MRPLRGWLFWCACVALVGRPVLAGDRPNVLFIAVDDLNDWVGCLGGHPQAKTPAIDALAARGMSFTRAYCASPVCNPSRTALLTGLRSSSSGVYDNGVKRADTRCKDVVPLNTWFHDHGYRVVGAGKIYHGDHDRWGVWDDYATPREVDLPPGAGESPGVGGIRFAPADGRDEDTHDFHTVAYCIEQLTRKHDKPLFLACGLHKPHMAWNVPRKYYDMFPLDTIQLPQVLDDDLDDVPPAGRALALAEGDHDAILRSGRWKDAVRGYLAAGAFCDAMIGRLLRGLDESPLRDSTIIVFWSDHGYHLGDHGIWTKHTNYEQATRIPLLIVAPGVTQPNTVTSQLTESVDLYPTLAELAGLPKPAGPQPIDGLSLAPVLRDPMTRVRDHVFHAYPNAKLGRAIRTNRYRLVEWKTPGADPESAELELYDYETDPHETRNVVQDQSSVTESLRKILYAYPEAAPLNGRPNASNTKGF
jgi:arylsulfatase A-like enzyme